jgi:hypothetical protein
MNNLFLLHPGDQRGTKAKACTASQIGEGEEAFGSHARGEGDLKGRLGGQPGMWGEAQRRDQSARQLGRLGAA